MNTKTILAVLFILFHCSAFSQKLVSRVYDFANDSDSGWKVFASDSTIYVLNAQVCMNNSVFCSGYMVIDYSGNVKYTKNIDTARVSLFNNIFVDDNIYLSLRSNSLFPDNFVLLYQFDLEGNLLKEKKLNHFGKLLFPLGITKGIDNNLVLSLKVENPLSEKDTCFFSVLDSSFNSITTYTKTESFANIRSTAMKPSDPGHFVYAQRPGYLSDVNGYVTKIDSTGTEVWKHELPVAYGSLLDVISDTTGVSYVIWQNDYWATWDTFQYPPMLIKLGKNGEKLWDYTFHSKIGLFLNAIFIAKNGDIIGCGVDDDLIENSPSYGNSGGWIFRMSPDGVLKWRRSIADLNLTNVDAQRLINGTELPNGDLVFCGDVGYLQLPFPTGIQDIWMIRTDSMGCLSADCGDIQLVNTTNEINSQYLNVELYPNPTDGLVNISGGSECQQLEKVDIFDVSGRYLGTQNIQSPTDKIDISSLSNGFYYVRLHLRDNKVIVKKIIKL